MVEREKEPEFAAKILAIKGTLGRLEVFDHGLMKEHGSGLNADDMFEFGKWLLEESPNVTRRVDMLRSKLGFLRHQRMVRLHIYAKNGPIPTVGRMFNNTGPALLNIYFHSQKPRTWSSSWSG